MMIIHTQGIREWSVSRSHLLRPVHGLNQLALAGFFGDILDENKPVDIQIV